MLYRLVYVPIEHKLHVFVSSLRDGTEGDATQASQMPSRDRSDLRCTDNTLTRKVSAPGSTRLSRNVKNELSNESGSCGDHCPSLDTDRRRRRKGAEEDDSMRLQGKRCPVGLRRRWSSRSIRGELQQELAYRSERRVTKTRRFGIQCGW